MRKPAVLVALLFGAALAAAASCATYADDLLRGQQAFEASQDERALAILRALEPDVDRLSIIDRAHYAYLRGMTDERIGYRADARHWLAIAAVMNEAMPGSLPPEWQERMAKALAELNARVYAAGIEGLSGPGSAMAVTAATDDADAPAQAAAASDE